MSRAPLPDTAKGEAPMPSSFDDDLEFWDEGRWSKLGRRLKEEPLVPLGLGLTCYALFGASRSMRRGDKEQTNRFFRARVYAQAFTLLCVCAGAIYWREDRAKRKEYRGLLSEKRAQEKKEAWIKELEAREKDDEEERVLREKRRKKIREEAALAATAPAPAPTGEKGGDAAVGAKIKGKQDEGTNTNPLSSADLRELLVDSRILRPAMLWWWSGGRGQ